MSEEDKVFRLEKPDRAEVEQLRRKERNARIYSRCLALVLLEDGKSVDEAAAMVGHEPSVIRQLCNLIEKKKPGITIRSLIAETLEN